MANASEAKVIASLDGSGEVVLTFAEPETDLMESLMCLANLKVAAHHAFEAKKAEAEEAWQQIVQGRARKAMEAPGTQGSRATPNRRPQGS